MQLLKTNSRDAIFKVSKVLDRRKEFPSLLNIEKAYNKVKHFFKKLLKQLEYLIVDIESFVLIDIRNYRFHAIIYQYGN